jgi:hypothetical protein
MSHDFGVIRHGKDPSFEFKFINAGNEKLFIQSVLPGRSCVTASPNLKSILPGHSGLIKVTYLSPGRNGQDTESVVVMTNDPTQPVISLKINVVVVSKLSVQPDHLEFGKVKKGNALSFPVNIVGTKGTTVISVEAKGKSVSVVMRRSDLTAEKLGVGVVPSNVASHFDVVLAKDLPFGKFIDEVRVKTNDLENPEIVIPVSGEIVGSIKVVPEGIELDNRSNKTVTIRVTSSLPNGFRVNKITVLDERLVVSKKEIKLPQGQFEYEIRASLKKTAQDSFETGLIIWTNDKDQPKVSVPVKILNIQ